MKLLSWDAVSDTVDAIYGSVGDPESWHHVLDLLCGLLHASSGAMTIQARDDRTGERWMVNYLADSDSYFGQHAAQNLLLKNMQSRRLGLAHISEELTDARTLLSSPYYAEWLAPNRIHSCLGVIYARDETAAHWVSLNRPKNRESFDQEDVQVLATLAPHLRRASALSEQLSASRQARASTEAALNASKQPTILTDGRGQVRFSNSAAMVLAEQQNGFSITRQGLVGHAHEVTASLQAAIRRAASGQTTLERRPSIVPLPRERTHRPLIAFVYPLPCGLADALGSGANVVVLIVDPDRGLEPSREALRLAYNLTPAETQIAVMLTQGKDVASITVELGVSRETIRTHLSSMFFKTGTRRQVDLVRLFANVAQAS